MIIIIHSIFPVILVYDDDGNDDRHAREEMTFLSIKVESNLKQKEGIKCNE
jgi:hypothetical protein